VWSCAALACHLAQKGFLQVSEETVRRHLQRLDYRIVRPVLSISSPDPQYASKAVQLQTLKEQARRGEIILLFEDEVDLNLLPGVIGCWTKRGQQRKVPTPGKNQKHYGFGAVNWISGEMIYHLGDHKNSDHFCALVEQIIATLCPGEPWAGPPIVLVVDNYIIHHSKKTTQLLQRYAQRLSVVALPTYAPKLNPVELIWRYLRRIVTHNHLYATMAELLEAVGRFFQNLITCPMHVLSLIGNSE
jgi:putative transposase